MREFLLGLVIIFGIGVVVSGCGPLVIGKPNIISNIAFFNGKLLWNVDHNVKKTHQAVLSAIVSLKGSVVEEVSNERNAIVRGEFSDHRNFTIKVDALTSKASKITIRIGVLGDEVKSNIVLNSILKRL